MHLQYKDVPAIKLNLLDVDIGTCEVRCSIFASQFPTWASSLVLAMRGLLFILQLISQVVPRVRLCKEASLCNLTLVLHRTKFIRA